MERHQHRSDTGPFELIVKTAAAYSTLTYFALSPNEKVLRNVREYYREILRRKGAPGTRAVMALLIIPDSSFKINAIRVG